MNMKELVQAARDFWRPNTYALKPYIIQDGKKHPFAVICPGGGYSMVSNFGEGEPIAKALNEMGYSAFVVYYRIRKKAKFPAPQDDLARGVREILERADEWNLDIEHYSVWGFSAGGHLAACFGTESMGYLKYDLPKPGALILAYPVITMGEKTHRASRHNLLGSPVNVSLIEQTSVEKQVTAAYPSTFVWYGDADNVVDPYNSQTLYRALKENGVSCRLTEYPGVGHGVGLGTGLVCEGWINFAVTFWTEQANTGKCATFPNAKE